MNASPKILALARRSIVRTLRQPGAIVPAVAFPLFFMAVISAGASSATKVPGFPTDSYLRFVLAGVLLQGALIAGVNSATDLAVDIESGFLNRLALMPLQRFGVVVGHVAGVLVVAAIQLAVLLGVALAVGGELAAGIGGIAVVLALSLLMWTGFAVLWAAIALGTGSSEAVQGAFPLAFIVFGFSSFFLPRSLVSVRWFHDIATWNPASYLIEGIRSLVITGWDGRALAMAFAVGGGLVLVGFAAASAALRRRLAQ